mmetsp:Transcript_143119/g.398784  ORF Transcript_143119/g.398784 Transcript_143119/m.398784 type:complete len:324 (-) Transcript_143119:457-1428(-)
MTCSCRQAPQHCRAPRASPGGLTRQPLPSVTGGQVKAVGQVPSASHRTEHLHDLGNPVLRLGVARLPTVRGHDHVAKLVEGLRARPEVEGASAQARARQHWVVVPDVQASSSKVLVLQRLEEGRLVHDAAPANVHQDRPPGQGPDLRPPDQVGCFGCSRQANKQGESTRQQIIQLGHPMDGHLRAVRHLLCTAKAAPHHVDLHAQGLQHLGDPAANCPVAQNDSRTATERRAIHCSCLPSGCPWDSVQDLPPHPCVQLNDTLHSRHEECHCKLRRGGGVEVAIVERNLRSLPDQVLCLLDGPCKRHDQRFDIRCQSVQLIARG